MWMLISIKSFSRLASCRFGQGRLAASKFNNAIDFYVADSLSLNICHKLKNNRFSNNDSEEASSDLAEDFLINCFSPNWQIYILSSSNNKLSSRF